MTIQDIPINGSADGPALKDLFLEEPRRPRPPFHLPGGRSSAPRGPVADGTQSKQRGPLIVGTTKVTNYAASDGCTCEFGPITKRPMNLSGPVLGSMDPVGWKNCEGDGKLTS